MQYILECQADGYSTELVHECALEQGELCYRGNCVNVCAQSYVERRYDGCEYWLVDLDNVVYGADSIAASNPLTVLVVNPGFFAVDAEVVVDQNDAEPGSPLALSRVEAVLVPPQSQVIIELPPREADGSPPGLYNEGSHSALTSRAYRLTSSLPVVVYQLNGLDEHSSFSVGSSLLLPTGALTLDYHVLGWPQTIADTNEPGTDYSEHMRSFLTIVGTETDTSVTVELAADIVGGGAVPARAAGETLNVTLGPFDVLNLETGSFGADFTGSLVMADKPVAAWSGVEAADVPTWQHLSDRECCADHLEQQLFPPDVAGYSFVVPQLPNRAVAVAAAGGSVNSGPELSYVRVLATEHGATVITTVNTTLAAPWDSFQLAAGEHRTIATECPFVLSADWPVYVGIFAGGRETTGVPSQLPGGDPAFMLLPPEDYWKSSYHFSIPAGFAFDFLLVASRSGLDLTVDGIAPSLQCSPPPSHCPALVVASSRYEVQLCQASFPTIDGALSPPDNVIAGQQSDGYHQAAGTSPFGLLLYGFDVGCSYGHPAGLSRPIPRP